MKLHHLTLSTGAAVAVVFVPALFSQSDFDRALANRIEHRATIDFTGAIERPLRRTENEPTSQPLKRDRADTVRQRDPAWSKALGVIVQSGYSTNPENLTLARGAWFARQAFEAGLKRATESGTFSVGVEMDSVVYERPARANNEIDPVVATGFKRVFEGKTVQIGASHGSAIIDTDTIVVVSGASGGLGLPLGSDSGWNLSLGGALETWDYRVAALGGLTATRTTGSVVLNGEFAGGPLVHLGVARVDNAARAAAFDSATHRLFLFLEPWTLAQSKWQVAGGLRFDRRAGKHVVAGLRRRDDIEVFTFDLSRPVGVAELVINFAHKRQRSNTPDSSFTERLGRIGLRRAF